MLIAKCRCVEIGKQTRLKIERSASLSVRVRPAAPIINRLVNRLFLLIDALIKKGDSS